MFYKYLYLKKEINDQFIFKTSKNYKVLFI